MFVFAVLVIFKLVSIQIVDGDRYKNLAQIRTIDKNRLMMPKITVLPDRTMQKIDDALKNSLALS